MIHAARRLSVKAALALSLVGGCGYSSQRLVSQPGVSSIAVLQFDNTTYRRDLEFRLTRAVAEEVRARTSWRIASPSTADALLRGTIRSADTHLLAEDKNDNPVVQRYRVTVDVELVERATGRVLRRYATVERQEFTPNRYGESLEGSATDTITTSLAEDIVQGLEKPIGAGGAVPLPRPPRPGVGVHVDR